MPLAPDAFPYFSRASVRCTRMPRRGGGAFYPVPLALLGQKVRVRWERTCPRVHGRPRSWPSRPACATACMRRAAARRRLDPQQAFVDRLVGQCERVGPVQAVGGRGARRSRRPRHSADSRRPQPHAQHPRERVVLAYHRSARPPAFSLSDHPPARRAHARASRADAPQCRSGHSPDDPIHLWRTFSHESAAHTRFASRLSGW